MEHLHVDAHPVRVQLEKKLGRQLMEYVFGQNGRPKKHASDQNTNKSVQGNNHVGGGEDSNATHDGRRHTKTNRDHRDNGPSLSRQNSSSEITPADSEQKNVRRKKSGSSLAGDEQPFLPFEADEMHSRATKNMTFVSVSFVQTTLVLSYKVRLSVTQTVPLRIADLIEGTVRATNPKALPICMTSSSPVQSCATQTRPGRSKTCSGTCDEVSNRLPKTRLPNAELRSSLLA
jgi:hypothetical protein